MSLYRDATARFDDVRPSDLKRGCSGERWSRFRREKKIAKNNTKALDKYNGLYYI